jgi:hypothetical protein
MDQAAGPDSLQIGEGHGAGDAAAEAYDFRWDRPVIACGQGDPVAYPKGRVKSAEFDG